nr:MFS transporter [uncultured Mucilaginibacter sp.]
MSLAHPSTTEKATRKEWLGLAVLALPVLLVSMDTTVLYLAVPAISAALKPGSTQLLWISDIYGFIEAGLLITMGTLGDRMGRRKLLIIGAVCFALASALAAYAPTANLLIAARALMGIAGATLLPSTLSIIHNMFRNEGERMTAMGVFTTCFSTGTMIGPLIGGWLLSHFWWGSVFLMGVPVMVLLLILGPLLLPETKDPGAGKFDLPSVFLLLITTLSVVFGIKQLAEHGIGLLTVASVLGGLIVAIIFISRQRKLADPLINLTLFADQKFNVALLALMLGLFSWAGIFLFVGQLLQLVFQMDSFTAGLYTLPAAIGSMISCPLAPVFGKRFDRGTVMAVGMGIMGAGLLILTFTTLNLTAFVIATGMLTMGCGTVVTLGSDMVIACAPKEKAGAAAGLYETSTAIGAALGIALLGSISVAVYRGIMSLYKIGGLSGNMGQTLKSTLGGAYAVSKKLNNATGDAVLREAQRAFSLSFNVAAGIDAVLILVITAAIALVLAKRRA